MEFTPVQSISISVAKFTLANLAFISVAMTLYTIDCKAGPVGQAWHRCDNRHPEAAHAVCRGTKVVYCPGFGATEEEQEGAAKECKLP
jgi:hypothetical protein